MKQLLRDWLNNYIKRSHWFNEVLFKDCRKFWDLKDEKFDVINLGSSSGTFDFNYEDCGLKGANWAVAPQSTLGDYVILKQYRSHIKDGGIVIYPLCPFTAISGAIPYLPERCFSFLDYNLFPGGHYITSFRINSVKDNPISIYPAVELIRDIIWHIRGNKERPKTEKELAHDAESKIQGWKCQFKIQDLSETFITRFEDVYKGTIAMISEMIDYCNSEGLKLILVIPPVYHTLAELLKPTAREQLLDRFMMEASGNKITCFNFIDEPDFSNDKSLFRDSYYLNEDGAKKFTKFILDTIKKRGL